MGLSELREKHLRRGGRLVLQTSSILGVADLMRANPTFDFQYNWTACLFGNQAHPGDFHYAGFTELTLRVHLEAAGFSVSAFSIKDGWLLNADVPKERDWTALLETTHGATDEEFLVSVYRQLLGRAMDDKGRSGRLRELRRGHSRYKILREVTASGEHLYVKAKELGLSARNRP